MTYRIDIHKGPLLLARAMYGNPSVVVSIEHELVDDHVIPYALIISVNVAATEYISVTLVHYSGCLLVSSQFGNGIYSPWVWLAVVISFFRRRSIYRRTAGVHKFPHVTFFHGIY